MSWILAVTHFVLMICLGVTLEVSFVALTDFAEKRDRRLVGYTYLWMLPIYAPIYPLLCRLYPRIAPWPLPARGLLYVSLIFAVEYASGWLLRAAVGRCPWDYGERRWAVHGLIRLDYAPAWFAASLLYELVFRILRGLA